MVSEFSSVKIGPFTYQKGRSFEDELVVDFGYPEDEALRETDFDYEKFNSDKKVAFDRLVCTDPKMKPNKVRCTTLPSRLTQKSFKKL
jgi:hypothetical protein